MRSWPRDPLMSLFFNKGHFPSKPHPLETRLAFRDFCLFYLVFLTCSMGVSITSFCSVILLDGHSNDGWIQRFQLDQMNVRVESVTKYSEPDWSMEIDSRGPFGMKYIATHGSQGINEQKKWWNWNLKVQYWSNKIKRFLEIDNYRQK